MKESQLPKARIIPVPVLRDNLAYLIHREGSRAAVVIDPSEAAPIIQRIESEGLELKAIINTHHHWDHVGGNSELAEKFKAPVWCSEYDLNRVPGASRGLKDGESFEFDDLKFEVLAIPGHTLGQIALYMPTAKAVFVGDTVFAMGCGRLFEGSPSQMWSSLKKLMSLPGDTRIYFGHEYTERNASFAKSVDPDNPEIQARLEETLRALKSGRPSEAPTLEDEIKVNPFLKPSRAATALNLVGAEDLEIFTELRRRRDNW